MILVTLHHKMWSHGTDCKKFMHYLLQTALIHSLHHIMMPAGLHLVPECWSLCHKGSIQMGVNILMWWKHFCCYLAFVCACDISEIVGHEQLTFSVPNKTSLWSNTTKKRKECNYDSKHQIQKRRQGKAYLTFLIFLKISPTKEKEKLVNELKKN